MKVVGTAVLCINVKRAATPCRVAFDFCTRVQVC